MNVKAVIINRISMFMHSRNVLKITLKNYFGDLFSLCFAYSELC